MTPDGWRASRYDEVMVETDERAGAATLLPVLSVTKTRGLMLASDRFGKVMHGRDLSKYRVAPRNHVVADPMLLWDGSIGLQTVVEQGLVSPDYRVYRPVDGALPEFLAYFVRSSIALPHYQGGARGTNVRRNRIARSDFLDIPLALPPLPEQRKIAAILSSVDEAIDKTQAVIDQLGVVKKAMMHELLTTGLPGRHTRFKQTEVGTVPEEWEVVPLGELVVTGPTNGKSPPSRATPPGTPTFSIAAVRRGRVNIFENLKYTDLGEEEVSRYAVKPGDILIVRGNANPDLIGKCGIVEAAPSSCIYPDILMRVRAGERMGESLLVTIWNADVVHEQLLLKAKTTNGTYKVNQNDVASTLVPVPPMSEQRALARIFDGLGETLAANEVELSALNRVKAALMSVLLTGEVRVTPEEDAA